MRVTGIFGPRWRQAMAILVAGTIGFGSAAAGDRKGPVTNLPLPRYVSLNSEKINVRRGPGLDYRRDWIFQRHGLPVRVIDEYEHWRRIVDSDEAGGWVYHALISGRRTALVTSVQVTLRARPEPEARPVAHAEQGVIARLLECEILWCRIEAGDVRGWVEKTDIWGVDPDEIYER